MRAATERERPPAPPTTTRSPTVTALKSPIGNAGEIEAGQRLDQPETCRLVIGQHGAGNVPGINQQKQIVSASVTR